MLRIFILAACFVLSPIQIFSFGAEQPNILFILADDLGWTALSCYGNKDVSTPNLDRLASQGMQFTSAYADTQCSPTRAAIFSGQAGARTGVFKVLSEKEPAWSLLRSPDANAALSPEVGTLATVLRNAGYTTGISGKWHIANNASVAPLIKHWDGKYFDRYGFDFAGPTNAREHRDDKAVIAITDDIVHFVELNQSKPWFAFVSQFSPHTPLEAPEALIAKHVSRGFQRAETTEGRSTERPIANYLAMIEHLDGEVGRLLTKLDELKISDRTVVVFTSDNGGLLRVTDNAPLREGKGSPYEGGIRVPLIVRWPGTVTAGSKCEVPVHAVDFYPTFAEIAGAKVGEAVTVKNTSQAKVAVKHPLDGTSLLPLLTQSGTFQRARLHWHMPTYTTNYGRTPCAVIREGDWKLIRWFGDYLDTTGFTPDDKPYGKLVVGPRTELYNIREDISEAHDLAEERPKKTKHLNNALSSWLNQVNAKLPEQNPRFDEKRWWAGERTEN